MGPRKKAKPNPKAEVDKPSAAPETVPLPETPGASISSDTPRDPQRNLADYEPPRSTDAAATEEAPTSTPSTKSWLGTWPRASKAAPITQVAKNSITSAGKVISEVAASATAERPHTPLSQSSPLRATSPYLSGKLGTSSRSLPISATTTKVNVSSSNLSRPPQTARRKSLEGKPEEPAAGEDKVLEESAFAQETGNVGTEQHEGSRQHALEPAQLGPQENPVENQTGWLGWFSRGDTGSDGSAQPGPDSGKALERREKNDLEEQITKPAESGDLKPAVQESTTSVPDQPQGHGEDPEPRSARTAGQTGPLPPRTWLSIWGSSGTNSDKSTNVAESINTIAAQQQESIVAPPENQVTSAGRHDTRTSSGWTFWSRGHARPATSDGTSQATSGKLAVADSSSESQPENAVVAGHKRGASVASKTLKRERPQSLQGADESASNSTSTTNSRGNSAIAVQVAAKAESTKSPLTKPLPEATPDPQNLILPPLKQTHKPPDSPGLLEKLRSLLYVAESAPPKHVNLLEKPPPIKKALAIGVHGYFPAPLLRSVLGQPTGTSIKFAEFAATAVQKWTRDHGYTCEVEKIALEGEGKIEERVDLLWKLLLNWIESVRKADFILVACHSQGVPVAIMLVAKLISFGCVHAARIGICAMAGVNLGPFADYKSRFINGTAGELFEFARPDSTVSKDYEAALGSVLRYGVKILYIGSLDDQLVSLEVGHLFLKSFPK